MLKRPLFLVLLSVALAVTATAVTTLVSRRFAIGRPEPEAPAEPPDGEAPADS